MPLQVAYQLTRFAMMPRGPRMGIGKARQHRASASALYSRESNLFLRKPSLVLRQHILQVGYCYLWDMITAATGVSLQSKGHGQWDGMSTRGLRPCSGSIVINGIQVTS